MTLKSGINPTCPQKTVVIITPCDLASDSRTLKQAHSFSRFGYKCIVFQGIEGSLDRSKLPFELHTITRPHDKQAQTPTPSTPKKESQQKRKILKSWIPSWLRYAIPIGRHLYRLFKYNVAVKRQIPKASLYYIHYFDCAPAVCMVAKKHQASVIYDAHDCHLKVNPIQRLKDRRQQILQAIYKKLEAWCINRAAVLVTVGEGVAELQHQLFGCRPQVIRNCHDYRLDSYTGPGIKQKLGLGTDAFLIVVVGMAKEGMAFQEIFGALSRLPSHVHLAFLGNGYDRFLKGEDHEAIKNRIHAFPAVKPYQVVPFVKDADSALIPYKSLTENYRFCLPNGFFQSIAAGLPLLYPDLPELTRIASHDQLGINIGIHSPETLSEAVHQLLLKPEILNRYKANCRQASLTLNWEQEEKKLHQILSQELATFKV